MARDTDIETGAYELLRYLDRTISRRTAIQLFGFSAVAAYLAACSSSPSSTSSTSGGPRKGGTFSFAPNGTPDTLDPHKTTSTQSQIVLRNVLDTLVIQRPGDLSFHPLLAKSWTISPDGMTYTFKLQSGVKFHDGTPFNASAVKFNLDRIVNPATKSALARTALGPYSSTTVVDDLTAAVNLTSAYPPLLDALSSEVLGMLSPTSVGNLGDSGIAVHPVGTGFMKFVSYALNDRIQLARNEGYNWASPIWGHQGPGYLDTITIVIIPIQAARTTALRSGDATGIEDVAPQDVAPLSADSSYTLIQGHVPGMPRAWFLNTEKPPLDNPDVRKAILYGMNRTDLLQLAFLGTQKPSEGPFSPGTLYYSPKVEGLYPYDATKAGQLLDGAGWKMGSNGIRMNSSGQSLTLLAPGITTFQTTYESTQALLRKIGVDVQIQMMAQVAWVAAVNSGAHHIAVAALNASDPARISLYFSSTNYNGADWARIKDAALDKMWADAAVDTNTKTRAALYAQIQLDIMQQALIYPVNAITRNDFVAANVKGITLDSRGIVPWLYDAYIAP